MRKLFAPFLLLAVFMLVLGSCTTDKMSYISKDYEIYGTWENPEYRGLEHGVAVVVVYPNNLREGYETLEKKELKGKFWYDITNRWIDREGNAWYTIIYIMDDKSYSYELVKISDAGNTMESMWSAYEYPKRIIPGSQGIEGEGYYDIRYRR